MTKPKKRISFFFPALRRLEASPFPVPRTCGTVAVSVTGDYCRLMCKHCGGIILKNMSAARTPSALKELARRIAEKGGRSILISGGADQKGMVPLLDFTQAIKEIRSESGLKVLVHTGLVSPQIADALAEAGVDLAMLDIIGDSRTIREVYHLGASVEDYEQSLKLLVDRAIPTAPHVVMGLHFGQILGEPRALEMIAQYPIKTLVLVGFRPIPKTAMAKTAPPSPEAMGNLFVLARKSLSENAGCPGLRTSSGPSPPKDRSCWPSRPGWTASPIPVKRPFRGPGIWPGIFLIIPIVAP